MDYAAHFAKATRLETLEIMLEGMCRKMRVVHDPSINSAEISARFYKKHGREDCYEMLMAAHDRQMELEESSGVQKSEIEMHFTPEPVKKKIESVDFESGLAAELNSWQSSREAADQKNQKQKPSRR